MTSYKCAVILYLFQNLINTIILNLSLDLKSTVILNIFQDPRTPTYSGLVALKFRSPNL